MKLPVLYQLLFSGTLLSLTSTAQNVVFNDSRGATPLTWDDFNGRPDKSSHFKAQTHYSVNWAVDAPVFKGDTARCTFTVTLALEKKCWVKKENKTPYLLNHEQRHYDIARLWAAEICSRLRNTVFMKKDYRAVIYSISNELNSKYRLMQILYDKETNHSIIENEQERWNGIIDKELAIYYPAQ